MEILQIVQTTGYVGVTAIVTFIIGEILKGTNVPPRFIPYINLVIGALSAGLCFWAGVLSTETPLHIFIGIASCLISALGAGGFYDVLKTKIKENEMSNLNYEEAVKIYGLPEDEIPEAPTNHTKDEEASN